MVFFDFLRFHTNNNVHVTVTIVLVSNSETLILEFFFLSILLAFRKDVTGNFG